MAARDREGYTLLLGMRSWEFEAFSQLRRPDAPAAAHAKTARLR